MTHQIILNWLQILGPFYVPFDHTLDAGCTWEETDLKANVSVKLAQPSEGKSEDSGDLSPVYHIPHFSPIYQHSLTTSNKC